MSLNVLVRDMMFIDSDDFRPFFMFGFNRKG